MGKCLRPEGGRFIGGRGGRRRAAATTYSFPKKKDPAAGISEGAHLVGANSVDGRPIAGQVRPSHTRRRQAPEPSDAKPAKAREGAAPAGGAVRLGAPSGVCAPARLV